MTDIARILALCAGLLVSSAAFAQPYPTKPVKIEGAMNRTASLRFVIAL
jgi:hypothetical protein